VANVFIKECLKLADLYIARFLEGNKRLCPNYCKEPLDSLKFFLLGYAFEHQGRSPNYAPVAVTAIDKLYPKKLSSKSSNIIWELFSKELDGNGLNHRNNPLCPHGTVYETHARKTRRTNGVSVVELVQRDLNGTCIVVFAKEKLISNNVKEAHKIVMKINGIGPKIASLFLRDVAILFRSEIKFGSLNNRGFLQPIDKWIRYSVRICENNSTLNDNQCANFIVKNTSEPEKANQGVWYFCTQIASSSEYEVKQSIENQKYMERLIQQHIKGLIDDGEAAKSFGG